MAKACKFCHVINSWICSDYEDCIECGRCRNGGDREPGTGKPEQSKEERS